MIYNNRMKKKRINNTRFGIHFNRWVKKNKIKTGGFFKIIRKYSWKRGTKTNNCADVICSNIMLNSINRFLWTAKIAF